VARERKEVGILKSGECEEAGWYTTFTGKYGYTDAALHAGPEEVPGAGRTMWPAQTSFSPAER
jgi:hypothetical protein